MAFDRPLEADRVDDLNLFGIFLRAPIIGTIMWFLGGDQAKREEEEMQRRQEEKLMNDGQEDGPLVQSTRSTNFKLPKRSALKKSAPSLAGSEVSDFGECAEALEGLQIFDKPLSSNSLSNKRKKELSWSDESGQKLVEYIEVETSARREPFTTENGSMIKSALSRSRSVRSHLEAPQLVEKRYLPRGLSRQHSGIVMPKPYNVENHHSSSTSDGESPQWGWYINTTPPTPEMYYSRSSKKQDSCIMDCSHTSQTSSLTSSDGSSESVDEQAKPNKVFQGLQNKNKDVPMDFPSVPL